VRGKANRACVAGEPADALPELVTRAWPVTGRVLPGTARGQATGLVVADPAVATVEGGDAAAEDVIGAERAGTVAADRGAWCAGRDLATPAAGFVDTGFVDTGFVDTGFVSSGLVDTGCPGATGVTAGAVAPGAVATGGVVVGCVVTGCVVTGGVTTGCVVRGCVDAGGVGAGGN